MKTPTKGIEASAEAVVSYILEHEQEDFWENPDRNHIYYHALIVKHGGTLAEYELNEAVRNKNEP